MSDTPIDPMHELVEDYAIGALDDAQRAAFEARLRTDAALRQALSATLETLGALALSTPTAPSAQLKQRVMERIAVSGSLPADVPPLPLRRRTSWAPLVLGAALAASLLLVASLAFQLRDARQEAIAMRAAATSGEGAVARRDSLIAQLTDPALETVTLAATGAAKPIVRAYVNRARRTMILSAGLLDTLPAGRAYQLWFIVDGKPVPSVTFRPDSAGRALVREVPMPTGAVAATAITQEPEGGSTAPTTPVLFVGKLTTE